MASIGWFPRAKFGPGSTFLFEKPTISAWSIREKQSQHNYQREEWDLEVWPINSRGNIPRSAGPWSNGIYAIPHPSTEFEPREVRRRQAALCPHHEVNALKCFHQEHATMTPALLGIREELQGDDDVVPGGYIVYMVFQHVPGFRLADDQGAPVPGHPLHTFFRKFKPAERAKIRDEFDKNYPKLAELNWSLHEPWADHLVWDPDSSKLWFVDFRKVMEAGWLKRIRSLRHEQNPHTEVDRGPMHRIWKLWGSCHSPSNPKDLDEPTAWKL
ncbi:hypothetical protein N7519_007866 [Penicillium mononematosum]|uniref:uncharacterized protein n=1 Tax=Penicillium mononematosum TaxID=268346 RepID=UPI0025496833|nr:uncharacterized protein N7519_007866 [Penicillium mononematosum]KAJ6186565.1 hypothetical protein N7519_007866 [Penicillium mononematosum]